MIDCAACGKSFHRDELISAAFTQEGQRNFFHKNCEGRAEHLTRWKEEAPWAFKPTRLTISDWHKCSPRKHLGVWQSMFMARRDEDVWCPDCGLKIARQEGLNCSSCGGPVIITDVETTKMVFTHHEPLYKLLLHCTEKGEDSTSYAVASGFVAVTVTSKKKRESAPPREKVMMLEYEPKGDPKQGLKV